MKGFRFYADIKGTEYEPGEHGFPRGKLRTDTTVEHLRILGEANVPVNCIALFLGDEHRNGTQYQEALVATFAHANSDTSVGGVSFKYLRSCRRVPEVVARSLHPRLFARLDAS